MVGMFSMTEFDCFWGVGGGTGEGGPGEDAGHEGRDFINRVRLLEEG